MQAFEPTHEVLHNGRTIPVMLVDWLDFGLPKIGTGGPLYTREEWETCTAADWTIEDQGLHFQGQVPQGESSFRRL